MSSLKERILQILEKFPHLKQADLARIADVKSSSVADWVTGETKTMRPKPARLLSAYLGCSQAWLSEGVGLPRWDEIAPVNGLQISAPSITLRVPTQPKAQGYKMNLQPFMLPSTVNWGELMEMSALPAMFVVGMPDAALAPSVMQGEPLLFETAKSPTVGDCVLVETSDGARHVRRYSQGVGDAWNAEALNSAYRSIPSSQGVKVLATLAWRASSKV